MVHSTFDVESQALADACKEAEYIKKLLVMMLGTGEEGIIIKAYSNSLDTIPAVKSSKPNTEIAKLKEMLEKKRVAKIEWISTGDIIIEMAASGNFVY